MGNVIEAVIGGLDKLLRIPSGCGEQTMLSLGPNVYVYRYLKATNQYSASLETSAKKYIEAGGLIERLAHIITPWALTLVCGYVSHSSSH